MARREQDMRKQGYGMVLTSTQVDGIIYSLKHNIWFDKNLL